MPVEHSHREGRVLVVAANKGQAGDLTILVPDRDELTVKLGKNECAAVSMAQVIWVKWSADLAGNVVP